MSKVFIVGGGVAYAHMFIQYGWEIADSLWDADLVQFTGGADVTPALYGEKNIASGNSPRRDIEEAGYFAIARRMHKPMAGICRGGQFLNVMCGGSMIQDVDGHAIHGTHMLDVSGVKVTSTHHQAMEPADTRNTDYYIVDCHGGVNEVLYYPDNECLCFQPHPEFNGYDECTEYYFKLLKEYLGF